MDYIVGYAGMFAVAVRIQNQDQFCISHQKIRGQFFIFFRKVKKLARTAKNDVLASLAKIRLFSDNSDTIARMRVLRAYY